MIQTRLIQEIHKRGYTIKAFCQRAGMSRSSFYRKVNGASDFTRGEMERISRLLTPASPTELFFAPKVS